MQKFNINEIELSTDLAFLLNYSKRPNLQKKSINMGINISGLLYRGGFKTYSGSNKFNQFNLKLNYIHFINELLEIYSNNPTYNVILIPHVIDLSEDAYDDDYKISKELSLKYNISIAPPFDNPIEAKSFISNMDVFIGSRMHSTIAAFSTGVLTIPVSYSHKFEGLYNSVDYNAIINGNKDDVKSSLVKIENYLANKNLLMNSQNESIKIINFRIKSLIDSIKIILDKFRR
jgi:polysaccharide pyruvyl transferase WcaK-like protein